MSLSGGPTSMIQYSQQNPASEREEHLLASGHQNSFETMFGLSPCPPRRLVESQRKYEGDSKSLCCDEVKFRG